MSRKLFLALISYIVICTTSLSYALQQDADIDVVTSGNDMSRCNPSAESLDNFEPRSFPKSNNLLAAQGKPEQFYGQKILLQGVLLDPNCVPISDAKIYLWQMAASGKFPYEFLRKVAPANMSRIGQDSFLGAGIAVTDNNGKFQFLTILPQKPDYPYVNFRIVHRTFPDFQTQYTVKESWNAAYAEEFANDQNNRKFAEYKVFYVKLVVPYSNRTRKY